MWTHSQQISIAQRSSGSTKKENKYIQNYLSEQWTPNTTHTHPFHDSVGSLTFVFLTDMFHSNEEIKSTLNINVYQISDVDY